MRRALMLMICGLILCLTACSTPSTNSTDGSILLFGGQVTPMTTEEAPDPSTPPATAVLIKNGLIEYVGDDKTALGLSEESTDKINLHGAVVIPGLIDSHCHLYGLGKALAEIDLMGTTSVDDVLDRVQQTINSTPGHDWLQGRGWDQNDWAVQAYPHATDLDTVTGDRPTLLRRVDGHAAWANTAALAAARINADTPDPDGGQILRDDDGRPTGILIDNGVTLVTDVIPEPSAGEVNRRIQMAMKHCIAHGLTGVHEAGVKWPLAQLYRQMADDDSLHLRIYGMYEDETETLTPALAAGPTTTDNKMLTLRAVKLYADGALGSRGALMQADYSDRPGHKGLQVTPTAHLRQVATAAGRAGFQVCTHAIGDQGNHLMLNLYETILSELELTDARWRIEHAQILVPSDIARFGQLGVIAAMQPVHCTSDMDWAADRVGQDRLAGAYAWRSLLDQGAHICWGTDFPVERVSALNGLYAARTRTHPDGQPIGGWQPQECVDGYTALRLYTCGSAYAGFAEEELGKVLPGYWADLTILSGDPVRCPPADLLDMDVLYTIVAGKIVYRRD